MFLFVFPFQAILEQKMHVGIVINCVLFSVIATRCFGVLIKSAENCGIIYSRECVLYLNCNSNG